MEDKTQDLIKKISNGMRDFSKSQRLIADYILNYYDKAAYLTAAKLAEAVGVSESTVVRFAVELGFDGYPKLQKEMQKMAKSRLTSIQRFEISSNRINEENILKSILQLDMEKIKLTLEEIDQNSFNKAVDDLLKARKIYILGVRSSAALANFLNFYFNLLFDDVKLVNTTSVSEMFEQIMRVSQEDVVIGISFPRYSRRTVQALQYVKSQHAKVIAITDSKDSPLAKHADYSLIARSDMASFVDSLVAPLSVINALIVAIGIKKKEEIYSIFNKLETIWDEYQVYEKFDEDYQSHRKAEL
jgi:DNA-binding MurR/RpiR family transcriptional regulator